MGVNIGVACMCVVSATKRLGSQEFVPSGSVLIDCASASTLVESSVEALFISPESHHGSQATPGSGRRAPLSGATVGHSSTAAVRTGGPSPELDLYSLDP